VACEKSVGLVVLQEDIERDFCFARRKRVLAFGVPDEFPFVFKHELMAARQRAWLDDFEAISLQDVFGKEFYIAFEEILCEAQIFLGVLSRPYDQPA